MEEEKVVKRVDESFHLKTIRTEEFFYITIYDQGGNGKHGVATIENEGNTGKKLYFIDFDDLDNGMSLLNTHGIPSKAFMGNSEITLTLYI